MKSWPLLLGLGIALAGCGNAGDSLLPMAVGKSWEYEVPPPIGPTVTTITVTRRVPVAGREGYELKSRFGTSRMVWKDGVLFASQTAGATFAPAIELYVPKRRVYKGVMTFRGVAQPVEGIVVHREKRERVKLKTQTYQAEVTDIRLDVEGGYYMLTNYFAAGVGLVQQDLRKYDARHNTLISRLRLLTPS